MLVIEKAIPAAEHGAPEEEHSSPRLPPSGSSRRTWPVVVMAAGVALVVAALALAYQLSTAPEEAGAGGRPPAPAPASSGITLGGPADVSVQQATYEPGQTSGWHAHTGMHAVLVLSGQVTFYDEQCRRQTYGAGDTYVGGQLAHVVRNETDEPAQLAVTYLFPAGQPHTSFHVDSPAPAGCGQ